MSKSAIIFENIRFCYDNVCAINNVSFNIPDKGITTFIGPNGGGKSTIFKLISGILKPDDGKLNINHNYQIGYVSQFHNFDLTFPMTLIDLVLLGTIDKKIRPFYRYSKEQKEKAAKALKQVDLKGYEKRGINQLSGGELKRGVIARAIASDANIIVLDEPDSSLDVESAAHLYKILNSIKNERTILIASHHLNEVLDIADTIIYVNGKIKIFNSAEDVRKKLGDGIFI